MLPHGLLRIVSAIVKPTTWAPALSSCGRRSDCVGNQMNACAVNHVSSAGCECMLKASSSSSFSDGSVDRIAVYVLDRCFVPNRMHCQQCTERSGARRLMMSMREVLGCHFTSTHQLPRDTKTNLVVSRQRRNADRSSQACATAATRPATLSSTVRPCRSLLEPLQAHGLLISNALQRATDAGPCDA
jgi:hypothetical protein